MEKSPDAFRTISEVAEDLDLPQHVLRFWETRFSQIKPMKRGGGRRYYRPEDVELLKGIRHLLYDQGYTIKGVQKLLKQNGPKFVIAVGSGDVATMEAVTAEAVGQVAKDQGRELSGQGVARPGDDDDQIVGRAKPPTTRRFFGLGGNDAAGEDGDAGQPVSKENRALLQEALYDLLECKRLLDQVR